MFAIVQRSMPTEMQKILQLEGIASCQNPPTETVNVEGLLVEPLLLEPPPHESKEAPRQTDATDFRIKLRRIGLFFCMTNSHVIFKNNYALLLACCKVWRQSSPKNTGYSIFMVHSML